MNKIDITITTICALICAWALASWFLTAFRIEPEWFEAINFWRICLGK